MRKNKVILVFFILFTFLSCNDDDNAYVHTQVEFKNIDDLYNCEEIYLNLNVIGTNEFYLIKDEEAFNNYVTSNCAFDINFNQYNLIIGKSGYLPNRYDFYKSCDNNFILNVISLPNTQSGIYTYHVLIKKEIIIEVSDIDISFTMLSQ